jgi:hypothetical protein
MRVLLIWSQIPDHPEFYIIQDPTEEELSVLKDCNGLYFNWTELTDEEDAKLEKINVALSKPEHATNVKDEASRSWASRWLEKKVEVTLLPESGPFDKVFIAGIYF